MAMVGVQEAELNLHLPLSPDLLTIHGSAPLRTHTARCPDGT
jgi:hypothetical protein